MDIFPEALEHFRKLLQFNTSNPPGNEKEAIEYLNAVLSKEGLRPQIIESAERRCNLVVRLAGDGSAKPLLISSHVDVVHAESDKWRHPPFSGVIAEDCIWGRGAVDMKNMTAYCLAAVLNLHRKKARLKRDIIMSVVADEETGGDFGMGYIVSKFPDLLRAEYALGELGGYTIHMKGKKIYPIQVGEKGIFWIKVKFSGSPGHGSMPTDDNVNFRAAKFVARLASKSLPMHLTRSTNAFMSKLASHFGLPGGLPFHLLKTAAGPGLLRRLARKDPDSDKYWAMAAMLANTANPTGLESGRQHNVVPSVATVKLDCRLLPGFTGETFLRELETFAGEKLDVEIVREAHGYESPYDTPLFREIEKQVERADPGAVVVPNLTVGFTDAQHLQKLGTICYGFTPIKLPLELNFPKLYHGHNERIPVEGFRWGLNVFSKTVEEFCSK